jgi:hypothetical protein
MKKTATPRKPLGAGIAKVLKRLHYPLDVMLLCVRWYVAYSLSLRDLEEMMAEPSTFCSEPSGTRLLPGVFLKRQSVRTVHPRP